ncbi:MAG: putative sulfate exporter family transporter [Bacteroidetes bacterium]|nr:putative sulfate exporter family transporter [Bacteroidota bacterium]
MDTGQASDDDKDTGLYPTFFGLSIRQLIMLLIAILCLTPLVSPPLALLMGIGAAQIPGRSIPHLHKVSQILLKVSVVGLGFGINIYTALEAGMKGVGYTVLSICATLVLGYLLGRVLHIERRAAWLISVGTAICGGSAIAAVSPVIGADEDETALSLGVIFILNSLALLLFPAIGHYLGMTQEQFGLWAAIAIHDTSSVVGAAAKYGDTALRIATTVKLARALWIIPVAFLSSYLFRRPGAKIAVPWFILFFCIAMLLNTFVPVVRIAGPVLTLAARAGLTLTLYLIGCGLPLQVLRGIGVRPLLQGVALWIVISVATLMMVR